MSGSDPTKSSLYDYSQSYRESKDRRDSEQHGPTQQPREGSKHKKTASSSSAQVAAPFEDVSLQDTRAEKDWKAKKDDEREAARREAELEEEPEEVKKVGSAPNAKPWLKDGASFSDRARELGRDIEKRFGA